MQTIDGTTQTVTRGYLEIDASIDVEIADLVCEEKERIWLNAIADVAKAMSAHHVHSGALIANSVEASVLVGSNARVQALNATFRGQDKPTNVLSFPTPEGHATHPSENNSEPTHIGDCILALGVLETEAAERDIPVLHHVQHLVVHGILHLLGYAHETNSSDADKMEAIETDILRTLGIADPYDETIAM
ncbi:MAG: rRNA maturation RNase YbeY [Pseudomonadota bacterium]